MLSNIQLVKTSKVMFLIQADFVLPSVFLNCD